MSQLHNRPYDLQHAQMNDFFASTFIVSCCCCWTVVWIFLSSARESHRVPFMLTDAQLYRHSIHVDWLYCHRPFPSIHTSDISLLYTNLPLWIPWCYSTILIRIYGGKNRICFNGCGWYERIAWYGTIVVVTTHVVSTMNNIHIFVWLAVNAVDTYNASTILSRILLWKTRAKASSGSLRYRNKSLLFDSSFLVLFWEPEEIHSKTATTTTELH